MPSKLSSQTHSIDAGGTGAFASTDPAPRPSPPRSDETTAPTSTSAENGDGRGSGVEIFAPCNEPTCSNPGTKQCGACEKVCYCSAACQKKHWRRKPDGHKAECKLHVAAKKKTASIGPAHASSSGGNRDDSSGGGGRIAQPLVIAVGCRVRIEGIQSKPELNGTKGVVTQAVAAIKKMRWHVQLDDTGAVVSLSESCLVPIAAAPKDHGIVDGGGHACCYICLDTDDGVIQRGCACRGSAGGAHVACMIEAAAHAEVQTLCASWHECSLCHKSYTGRMQKELTEENVRRMKHLPQTDTKSILAHFGRGMALTDGGEYRDAEVVFRTALGVVGAEHPIALLINHQLAGQ